MIPVQYRHVTKTQRRGRPPQGERDNAARGSILRVARGQFRMSFDTKPLCCGHPMFGTKSVSALFEAYLVS
jgi:hypothetical protein